MPFEKGNPGRPSDRSKSAHRITVIARKHARKAIKVAAAALDDSDTYVRLKAAAFLLDRGIGKPAQCVTASQLTDEELVEELMKRKAARAEQRRDSGSAGGVLDS
jgi:hypothetical protein